MGLKPNQTKPNQIYVLGLVPKPVLIETGFLVNTDLPV